MLWGSHWFSKATCKQEMSFSFFLLMMKGEFTEKEIWQLVVGKVPGWQCWKVARMLLSAVPVLTPGHGILPVLHPSRAVWAGPPQDAFWVLPDSFMVVDSFLYILLPSTPSGSIFPLDLHLMKFSSFKSKLKCPFWWAVKMSPFPIRASEFGICLWLPTPASC